jgi:hypothetical protein
MTTEISNGKQAPAFSPEGKISFGVTRTDFSDSLWVSLFP